LDNLYKELEGEMQLLLTDMNVNALGELPSQTRKNISVLYK
jgi:hypothetical protein